MRRGLHELLRLPTRREAVRGVGAVILAAAICWYFGVNVWHSILLGCAVTVASFALSAGTSIPEIHDLSWRHRSRSRAGSRSEVATLAGALRSGWDPVGLTAERRLHAIARRRLALEGLDLRNPDDRGAIERRIGTRAYHVLIHPGGRRPRLPAVIHCLDALDALDADYYLPPQRGSRWHLPHLPIPSNLRRTRER
jgi:hypothetical protein